MNSFQGFWGMMQNSLFIYPVLIWSLTWKGLALWKAARKEHKIWFVVLLVVNTLGLLEILYLYVFSKSGKDLGYSKDSGK